jgi:serine/threonine protein kinase
MTTWNPRANDLFLKALGLGSPEERQKYLDEACGGEPALQAEVEALLNANARVGHFLESPAPDPGATRDLDSSPRPLTESPGTVIGPYKLLEQIGEGGMGVVYMAEQARPVRRKVALKIIKPGMDTRQVIARFEAERQALALMDHPNIARVLDAGATDSARPYFVMELVRGIPITEYCDRNHLEIADRSELFVLVCQAVQHAHQKGIIHRDLKPSNVLVTLIDGAAVPKIIDFGVAKAMGQQLTEKTLFTGFAQLIGTPLYMSPEQAELSGVDIDTRSDIYSLGVLLYELLTGTTPFDATTFRTAGYDEIRRIIREQEPRRPSTRISTLEATATTISANRRTDPQRLRKALRGELDWIVMKCLDKDRNRRYETAAALGADVRHYLHDQPVLACPPSARYRFGKFARRHRVAITIGTVVTAALLVLIIGLSAGTLVLSQANRRIREQRNQIDNQRQEVQEQRDLAQKNFHKALEAVDDFFTKVSENTLLRSPLPGLKPLRRELLETAVRYYQRFVEEHRDEPGLREELAAAHIRVGSIRYEIGLPAGAVQAYQSAIDLLEKLTKDNPSDLRFRGQLAACLRPIGRLQTIAMGRAAQGLVALDQARDLYEALTRADPDDVDFQSGLARTYGDLALCHGLRSHGIDELAYYRKALAIWKRLAAGDHRFRRELGSTTIDMGFCYTRAGQAPQALESFEQAREIFAQLSSDDPIDTTVLMELERVYVNIGYLHESVTEQYPKALQAYQQSRDILERLARDHPAVADFQFRRAGMCMDISSVFQLTERFSEAKEILREAQEILERIVAADPAHWRARQFCARCYMKSGLAELGLKRFAEAHALSSQAQTIFEEQLRAEPGQLENLRDLSQ